MMRGRDALGKGGSFAFEGSMTISLALATTSVDPRNPRAWSGTPNAILSALQKLDDVRTSILGPLDPGLRLIEGARKLRWRLESKRYLWEREPRILRRYRSQFQVRLNAIKPEVVLALGTIPAAAMPQSVPYIVYIDATFKLNVDYYPTMTGICERSLRLGNAVDQMAFQGANHVVATSEWAAASVIHDYGVPAKCVSVIPIGAQHVCPLAPDKILEAAASRMAGPLRLLWIGVEWQRKGGDIAVAIARDLHSRGIDVELHIVGLTPESEICALPFVKVHGFLDARTQNNQLVNLFISSFALLLPSRAENTSVVIADAASFGVPSFVSDTGGMRTMVRDGVNGEVMSPNVLARDYADAVLKYWSSPSAYMELVRKSRRRFETDLSWPAAMRGITDIAVSAATKRTGLRAAA
jgi:glycosyltransferase involved in cell wall biosynthesis